MKPKSLVSLSVAFAFLVLSVTGLLIYFAQGSHAVEHIHAWFGILFVGAAVFHIVNNWSSIIGYSRDRRTGGIRREFVAPVVLAVVFTAGIGFDWPVFSKLANAGKELVRGPRPKREPLAQTTVDSIAEATERAYVRAQTQSDTAGLAPLLANTVSFATEDGTVLNRSNVLTKPALASYLVAVGSAALLDENLIVVRGTAARINPQTEGNTPLHFIHLLKRQGDKWQLAAGQLSR